LDILGTDGDWPRVARYIWTEISDDRCAVLEIAAKIADTVKHSLVSGAAIAAEIRELKE